MSSALVNAVQQSISSGQKIEMRSNDTNETTEALKKLCVDYTSGLVSYVYDFIGTTKEGSQFSIRIINDNLSVPVEERPKMTKEQIEDYFDKNFGKR